jgi:hypothetical protein
MDEMAYVKKEKVQPFRLCIECPECRNNMEFTGMSLPSNPPWFIHRCECGHSEKLKNRYPRIVYMETDN